MHRNAHVADHVNTGTHRLKRLYMIGDNPSVDICGARKVCLWDFWNFGSVYHLNLNVIAECIITSKISGRTSLVLYSDKDWSFQGKRKPSQISSWSGKVSWSPLVLSIFWKERTWVVWGKKSMTKLLLSNQNYTYRKFSSSARFFTETKSWKLVQVVDTVEEAVDYILRKECASWVWYYPFSIIFWMWSLWNWFKKGWREEMGLSSEIDTQLHYSSWHLFMVQLFSHDLVFKVISP